MGKGVYYGVGHFHHKRAEFQGSASLGCFQEVSHAFAVVQMPMIDNIPLKNIFKLQNKIVLKNYILRMENKNTSACVQWHSQKLCVGGRPEHSLP